MFVELTGEEAFSTSMRSAVVIQPRSTSSRPARCVLARGPGLAGFGERAGVIRSACNASTPKRRLRSVSMCKGLWLGHPVIRGFGRQQMFASRRHTARVCGGLDCQSKAGWGASQGHCQCIHRIKRPDVLYPKAGGHHPAPRIAAPRTAPPRSAGTDDGGGVSKARQRSKLVMASARLDGLLGEPDTGGLGRPAGGTTVSVAPPRPKAITGRRRPAPRPARCRSPLRRGRAAPGSGADGRG